MSHFLLVLPLDFALADEFNIDSTFIQRTRPTNPLAVCRLNNGWFRGMLCSDGNKLPVGTIEFQKTGVVWKLLELPF